MFGIEEPASGVGEVVRFLESNQPENYLFRGQVRASPTLIPSGFRKAVEDSNANRKAVRISSERYGRSLQTIEKWRFLILDGLIRRYGRAFGNLFAQQYGLSSEAIDITGSPRIAGFFASRDYPAYTPCCEKMALGDMGVIYRFPKPTSPPFVVGVRVCSEADWKGIRT